jgi:hypothetical protein
MRSGDGLRRRLHSPAMPWFRPAVRRLRRFADVAVLALQGEELGPRINLGMLLDERPPLAFSHAPRHRTPPLLSSASARHSAVTGQCRQMTAAFLCPLRERRIRRDRSSDIAPSTPTRCGLELQN